MSVAAAVPVPLLSDDLDFLDIVTEWDASLDYQDWRAQVLVPVTFRPAAPPRVVVVANQKGGAGKTTSALELAMALVARGYRVRVIDADPQRAALSLWLQPIYPERVAPADRKSLTEVFFDTATLAEATYPTRYRNLFVVPSGPKLGTVESMTPPGTEGCLRHVIGEANDVDVTVIDCGPSLGSISVSALVAADDVVIPVKTGGLDLQGMSSLHKTLMLVKKRSNPKMEVRAVLLTEWERSNLARQLAARVAADYPAAIVSPIRKTIRAREAPLTYKALREFAPDASAVCDYDQVTGLLFPAQKADR